MSTPRGVDDEMRVSKEAVDSDSVTLCVDGVAAVGWRAPGI